MEIYVHVVYVAFEVVHDSRSEFRSWNLTPFEGLSRTNGRPGEDGLHHEPSRRLSLEKSA